MLVQDLDIRIIHAATGELLRELALDPGAVTTSPPATRPGHPANDQTQPSSLAARSVATALRCSSPGRGPANDGRTPGRPPRR